MAFGVLTCGFCKPAAGVGQEMAQEMVQHFARGIAPQITFEVLWNTSEGGPL
jgi:hypothetical protein